MKKRSYCIPIILFFLLWMHFNSRNALCASAWVSIGPEGGAVSNIAPDPKNSNVLYLASAARAENPVVKIYKSTNKGNSWTFLSSVQGFVNCFEVSRRKNSDLFLGGNSVFFRSTDSGVTWSNFYPNQGFYEVTSDSLDANVVHACGYDFSTPKTSMAYFKSTDKGTSWNSALPPMPATGDYSYAYDLAVDPKNSKIVWIGGFIRDNETNTSNSALFRTTNGGTSWTDVTGTISGEVYDINIDSTAVKRIVVLTSSGVFRTTNNGTLWQPNSGFVSPYYKECLAQDPKNKNIFYVGGYNCIYKSTDGGVNWNSYLTGISGEGCSTILVDQGNSSNVFLGNVGGVLKSTNAGETWAGSNAVLILGNVTALELKPTAPSILYVAMEYSDLYKTSNALGKADSPQTVSWEFFYKIPDCTSWHVEKNIFCEPTNPDVMVILKGYG
jgi:photosystem II stability/assembly factor-like uncharacterized protein